MKDLELYGRLKLAGVPEAKAWRMTAHIRDTIHPLAAVVHAKLNGAGESRPLPTLHGLGLNVSRGIQAGSMGAKAGSFIPIPIVGTVVGAALGFLIGGVFGPAKLGQASVTWNDMTAHNYLSSTPPTQFDERYFGEAMKGAMDEGNNVWPQCGSDRHKDPDCFFGALAQTILAAYQSGRVPVNANDATVWSGVVLPWLQSGAGGKINWGTLANEPQQQLLIHAATNRYINGMPIVRGDMAAYAGQGYTTHIPSINSVLAQAPAVPTVSTAVATQSVAAVPANIVTQANQITAPTQYAYTAPAAQSSGSSGGSVESLLANYLSNQGVNPNNAQAQAITSQVAAQGVSQTAYGPPASAASGLPSWLLPAGIAAVVAAKVLL